ncbi:hypothetical protein L227DRAFT_610504 [Lentinus tigrinus ALCF2SS1-6]|uniref:Uncharacterized protein n=1 Tax=Lentinus tigrinus ALCF2SS1-6 TaxID=1328759 RepID=A0A5C2SE86_9APHY|nr:hypothetical protein L227DRAFT_610504 [Lentinus tigrinus ALCF2SS1-6]
MPTIPYVKRVRQALHQLVKDHQGVISLYVLNVRILGPDNSTNPRHRLRSESRVRNILNREVRARRITIDRDEATTLVTVTMEGWSFYRAFGSPPVYAAGDARLMRLTIPQLYRQADALRRILEDIQGTFLDHYPDNTDAQSLATLPDAIRVFYETLSDLEYSNSELQLEMNYEEGRSRRLRSAHGSES